jgi:hypothetical protein
MLKCITVKKPMPRDSQTLRKRPDFLARLKQLYGAKLLEVSGADLLQKERARY